MGMKTITEPLEKVNMEMIKGIFPHIERRRIVRPVGEVNLLLGIGPTDLHPYLEMRDKNCVGKLKALTSEFGTGVVLDGSYTSLDVKGGKITNWVYEITRGRVSHEIPPRIGSGGYGGLEGTLPGQSPAPPPMGPSPWAVVGRNSPS